MDDLRLPTHVRQLHLTFQRGGYDPLWKTTNRVYETKLIKSEDTFLELKVILGKHFRFRRMDVALTVDGEPQDITDLAEALKRLNQSPPPRGANDQAPSSTIAATPQKARKGTVMRN